MVRLISRQRGGLAPLKLTKLFGINDFPASKDSGKVLITIIYCYLIINIHSYPICEASISKSNKKLLTIKKCDISKAPMGFEHDRWDLNMTHDLLFTRQAL